MKSSRTKATDISAKVRQEVYEREQWCIVCGSPYNLQVAHYIPRSKGGKGIAQNLVRLCFKCHFDYDMTSKRGHIGSIIADYLKRHYGVIDKKDLVYRKD